MKVLLDTNIFIHREAATAVNDDIGILFRWLDNLHYTKCIHPISVAELEKYKDAKTLKSMKIKLGNYNVLKTTAPISQEVLAVSKEVDVGENDKNDTLIINELYSSRVDLLITEDKLLLSKAVLLGISDKVYTIDSFLEKVTTDNPALAEYNVLAVRQEFFGNLNLNDNFFLSFKEEYPGFEKWFNKKADEIAYVCQSDGELVAFLYLKKEGGAENYTDIEPVFTKKTRLKIGTFKVDLNGYRLGERFLKIVFDNALRFRVDELYVTIFDKSMEQIRLINLLENFGFCFHGKKRSSAGEELVYVRDFSRKASRDTPKLTFPFFSAEAEVFLTPIYPQYHTELFPDSILRTESPHDFIENEPHRNAISKVYISRAIDRSPRSGDIIIFYRTGGYHKSVVTTIGIVEQVTDNIQSEADFIRLCRKRSVFTEAELSEHWNYRSNRPFIVDFLYTYSFPSRINMRRLIEIGVLAGREDAPRGFKVITKENLINILRECNVDESLIVH